MPPLEQNAPPAPPLDLATARERLAAASGRAYWRSLEELAASPEFGEMIAREFPRQASAWSPAMDRRAFLNLLGASLALAGLSGCASKQPDEVIVPYVASPDAIVPGVPLTFASAMTLGGYGTGVLVTSREGRPIKVDGNPDHPASLGGSDAILQASLLGLYDPNRSQSVLRQGIPNTWDGFLGAIDAERRTWSASGGAGLRILTQTVTSPTLAAQIRALLARYPSATWHQYDPIHRDNVRAGARAAFGADVNTIYDFGKAEVIVSLDADFLLTMPGHIRYARDFSDRRRVLTRPSGLPARADAMNRLYAAESSPSITGAMADHRIALRPGEIEAVSAALAQRIAGAAAGGAALAPDTAAWLDAAAKDLQAHPGASVVAAGDTLPARVHAEAHAVNAALGAAGVTVIYTEPVEAGPPSDADSLAALVRAMQSGQVEALVILGGNPAYDAPSDLDFAAALGKTPFSVHLAQHENETSALCLWHIPEQHYLESWSDARAYDGAASIVQPVTAPLYSDSRSAHELLDAMLAPPGRSGHDIVKEFWRHGRAPAAFEEFWRKSLRDGVVADTAARRIRPTLAHSAAVSDAAPPPDSAGHGLEILFRPDPNLWDGRFANNPWLQELPKPLSKLTWDNAALMSPHTAEQHGVVNEDVVELTYRGRAVRAPAWILPGHADDCVTVTLGYGRSRAGGVGTGVGFDAYALRTSDAPWNGPGLSMAKTPNIHRIACTHTHHTMEGRDLIRVGSIDTFRRDREFAHGKEHAPEKPPMLLPESPREGYAWGMAIDNNVCIGCGACVAACQAENNIPSVGKEEVLRGREMHWLRVDRYYGGSSLDRPEGTYFMPVPCMQCEKAPCELVCPVGATVHDKDGINDMVYNRCVGTRYCSNNCPYKVRRFNFLQYSNLLPVVQLMRNPEVTVRTRGVMEKCTYCTQRIQSAKIDAEKQDRTVRDGEIVTACQQACPTHAIVFGDINDPGSEVSRRKSQPQNYSLLSELNTRPRTTYLAKLENPNPDLEAKSHVG
jgi:MoCo/4Fe-4S cofactor protein with predicted Tat translocation signal